MWIQLQSEIDNLIYGDRISKPQGYWSVLRIFRKDQLSEYWNEDTKEAVGGPKYKYDDHIVRIISIPLKRLSLNQSITNIADSYFESEDVYVFALSTKEHIKRLPDVEDIVYHIREYYSHNRPSPPLHVTDRFKILNAHIAHGDYGKAEVIYLVGERIHGES